MAILIKRCSFCPAQVAVISPKVPGPAVAPHFGTPPFGSLQGAEEAQIRIRQAGLGHPVVAGVAERACITARKAVTSEYRRPGIIPPKIAMA
jgi:hypothetical protein